MSTGLSLHNPLSPTQTALLILEMRRQRDVELGKSSTRFRISARTLRALSGRSRIREAFVEELQEALASQHLKERWLMMPVDDGYAFVTADAVNDWPRISSKRIAVRQYEQQSILQRAFTEGARVFADLEERYVRVTETDGKENNA